MIILSRHFKQFVPGDKRKDVSQYMRREGWIKNSDGDWRSPANFLFNGNGKLYLEKAVKHCQEAWEGVVDDYNDENNDYEEYLSNL